MLSDLGMKLESPSGIALRCRGGDTQAVTPFAVGCQRMGMAEIGGKLDDVAVSCLPHQEPKGVAFSVGALGPLSQRLQPEFRIAWRLLSAC